MKKLFVTLVTLTSLCHVSTAQSTLDAKLNECRTVVLSVASSDLKFDSDKYYTYWIEKQVGAGVWELHEKKTTNSATITFENLASGRYRALQAFDNHEHIYYDPAAEKNNDRALSAYFTVTDCTGDRVNTEDAVGENLIQLFPNPASNVLNLLLNQDNDPVDAHLDLVDVAGRVVLTQPILSVTQDIDISSIKSGSYTALVTINGVETLQKLVIVLK